MPTKNPTTVGVLKQLKQTFTTDSWGDGMPDTDSTAQASMSIVNNRGISLTMIYTYTTLGSSVITAMESWTNFVRFDTSDINEIPAGATLKIYGTGSNSASLDHDNTSSRGHVGVGDDKGIVLMKSNPFQTTSSVNTIDWGALDISGSGPTLYSDTLNTWIAADGANTFTLNETALSDIASNDSFQFAVTHKFLYNNYDESDPLWTTGNSPEGDNDINWRTGMHTMEIEDYYPVLEYSVVIPPARYVLSSGTLKLTDGKIECQ